MSIRHLHGDATVYATTSLASVWWTALQWLTAGWNWSLMPPLLLAIAAMIGAIRAWRTDAETWRDRAQERRHRDERHALELERLRKTIEQLPTRS